MKYNIKVRCPRCNEKFDVLVINDPGGREIGPPSQEVEFDHQCKENDGEWTDKEEHLFDVRVEGALIRWGRENHEP